MTTSDAAGSLIPQDLSCSTSGNYTASSAYAANVNQFLAALPENAVAKNGGFYNGTVGEGLDAVYGLAMCPADYSRADCGDCLTAAAASDAPDGLLSRCPGSTTVLAMFERCLIRYSNASFLGTPETEIGNYIFLLRAFLAVSRVSKTRTNHDTKSNNEKISIVHMCRCGCSHRR